MYEYKIERLNFSLSGKQKMDDVLDHIESEFTRESADGWEYYGTIPVTTSKNPGCLAGLTGAGPIVTTTQVAVFRRML